MLQAAALIPAEAFWEEASWQWALEDQVGREGHDAVSRWIAQALEDGVFDWQRWLKAGLREHAEDSRCKAAVVQWGVSNVVVSVDVGRAH